MNAPRPLTSSDILRIWEWGIDQSPLHRALAILSVVYPDVALTQLAALSIGGRDAHLLAIREQTFGTHLQGTAACPACQERLEFGLTVSEIRTATTLPHFTAPEPIQLAIADYTLLCRLPTTQDLLALSQDGNLAHNQQQLVEHFVLEANHDGVIIAPSALPANIISDLIQQLAVADPQAEIILNLTCLACHYQWSQLFDIATFLWTEIAVQAQRLLQEVHLLASVYGWREADILALSSHRRNAYLEMIRL
ncbi:hypothetical protein ACX27_08570 [Nostoc piscinale CENA21]|uniref:Phage baseplate protein n=1 Tax=Nostoc piscinale CENA21 TaxID=224013 RepID=A0A0M4TJI2_9NOSO|nr:hypothetical protein [Nostoc piscinale]ALF52899.1 hypothetical protein ACX27_08570 [Nostoc piscinale CENA21]